MHSTLHASVAMAPWVSPCRICRSRWLLLQFSVWIATHAVTGDTRTHDSGFQADAAGGAGAPILTSPVQLQRLDDLVTRLMRCRAVSGLTLTVVVGDGVTLTRGYGMADVERRAAVDGDTVFCVASLTKAFTAVLLGRLLQRTSYTWDTRVADILGEDFRLRDSFLTSHVTIRDLLLHRTGIPRYDFTWFSGSFNRSQLLSHLKCLPPRTELRERAIYNNVMFMLAGHVAEKLGGKTWEDLVTDEILKPLDMTNTTFFYDGRGPEDRFCKQYSQHEGRPQLLDYAAYSKGMRTVAPAISLCSTARDMAKWMRFWLSQAEIGTGGGGLPRDPAPGRPGPPRVEEPLLPAEVLAEMTRPQVAAHNMYYSEIRNPRTPVSYVLDSYALGWFTGYYRGLPVLAHYGSFPGQFSHVSLLPIYRIGVFSSFNGGHQDLPYTVNSLLHTFVLDLVLGHRPWIQTGHFQPEQDEICHFPNHPPPPPSDPTGGQARSAPLRDPVPAAQLRVSAACYIGNFTSSIYGSLHVGINGSSGPGASQGGRDVGSQLVASYGLMRFVLVAQDTHPDHATHVFRGETATMEYMTPTLEVRFHWGPPQESLPQTCGTRGIQSVELPALDEPNMESSGTHFYPALNSQAPVCSNSISASSRPRTNCLLNVVCFLFMFASSGLGHYLSYFTCPLAIKWDVT